MTRRAERALPGRTASLRDLQQAGLHLLRIFFACMTVGTHIRSNTGLGMQPALGKRTAHAFAHARLAGMSRELVPGECTQLCLGAELPGKGIGDHAI